MDKILGLLRVVRDFRNNYPDDYDRIKTLPVKSRTGRSVAESGKPVKKEMSLVYIASSYKKEFYKVEGQSVTNIGFLEAVELFEAKPEEQSIPLPNKHYQQVGLAYQKFDTDVTKMLDDDTTCASEKDNTTDAARSLIRRIRRAYSHPKMIDHCDILLKYVELGTYSKLTRDLARLERRFRRNEVTSIDVETAMRGLIEKYHKQKKTITQEDDIIPQIVLSETFI